MLGDVGPGVKLDGKPGSRVENAPVDNGDEEGQGNDGGVEERVAGLEGSGEVV